MDAQRCVGVGGPQTAHHSIQPVSCQHPLWPSVGKLACCPLPCRLAALAHRGRFGHLQRPGIEPGSLPWQGSILPLDQRCRFDYCSAVLFATWTQLGTRPSHKRRPNKRFLRAAPSPPSAAEQRARGSARGSQGASARAARGRRCASWRQQPVMVAPTTTCLHLGTTTQSKHSKT